MIVGPEDCVLAFGIPTDKAVFFADQYRKNKDFAKRYDGVWSKYYHQFISEFEQIIPKLKNLGLRIERDLTLVKFRALFKQYKVVILFSHWQEDKVEFHEGLQPLDDIIEQIPTQFGGVIDLCVCHPNGLALKIRQSRPNTLTKFIPNSAIPYFWLHFYLVLFKHLHQENKNYLSVLDEVSEAFFK